jgi:hypothetical protein
LVQIACVSSRPYGALVLTRRLLAQTLAEKVLEDSWSEALAPEAAERLLARNAIELYSWVEQ